MNLKAELERRVTAALAAAGAPDGSPAIVGQAARAEFGDYQANGVMPAAKAIGIDPRQLAEKVVAQLGPGGAGDLSDLTEPPTIAGPGFINIRLKADWLARQLGRIQLDESLGVERADEKNRQTVVVDYSGPNLAKEMHVGHLRSTIIGDALARTLDFLGHTVIRQNHIGDWGTPFGMLTAFLDRGQPPNRDNAAEKTGEIAGFSFETIGVFPEITDMEVCYREAKQLYDTDPAFAAKAREYVVKLQSGDRRIRGIWNYILDQSMEHVEQVYRTLGVLLTRDDVRGEGFYSHVPIQQQNGKVLREDWLPKVITDLRSIGLIKESQGAQCVFLEEFKDKDGEVLPLIVQKTDEGYLYATTDLAAIRYRVNQLKADRILYVTDSRQALHFRHVFAVARAAKFAPESVSLEHVAFGMMLGADGKPFRTREGGTVKLMALLDEAEQRAFALVSEKNPELDESRRHEIAHVVGIGAVKYADLSQNRISDYVFSWDKLLSLEGNTAPYMQYAYARVRSIFRKGQVEGQSPQAEILIRELDEKALALRLVQFPETVAFVAAECLPNVLCAYLYELAGAFMGFYENCPVLQAEPELRASRLSLCELTARTIRTGLDLLGIQTIEQM
jgi:arginyl-tRNA synthetase